jgi:hypothetical protein
MLIFPQIPNRVPATLYLHRAQLEFAALEQASGIKPNLNTGYITHDAIDH